MKALRLDLFQQTACYRKPFAIKISETYPLPPYSTVNGLLHRILDAKEYIPMNISIQGDYESIINDYQTTYFYKKDTVTTMPMNQHMLLNVKLIIHINAEEEIMDRIYDRFKNLDEFLSLGRREDLLRIDDVRFVDIEEYDVSFKYQETNGFKLETYDLKHSIYIPKKYNVELTGINYRLNNYYKNTRNKWEKVDTLFVQKENQIVSGKILLDSKKDIVYFNNFVRQNDNKEIQNLLENKFTQNIDLKNKKTSEVIIAKTEPYETLREHTDELRKELIILKKTYGKQIEKLVNIEADIFWNFLDMIVEFHDLGKVYTPFQNNLKNVLNDSLQDKDRYKIEETNLKNDIGHNYMSPAFIDFGVLDDIYGNLEISEELYKIMTQSIIYHHERDILVDKELKNKIVKIIKEDLNKKVELIESEFKPKYPIRKSLNSGYLTYADNRIKSKDPNYNLYIMMKGLTHRLDHSASGHEEIEVDSDKNIAIYTDDFFKKKNFAKKPAQEFAIKNRDKNIVLVASTGMGKTETALFWIDEYKAFFTLPLRVSINALYDRVSQKNDIAYEYAGLLHSTSLDYLKDNQYDNFEKSVSLSRQLSRKLTFSTIDQIFKFPLQYKGYEKEYATLAYSKVVIDEIQAYSPEIVAILIKGIEMIHKIGGKFMIMTATMPTLYLDEMEKRGILDGTTVMDSFVLEKERHNIKVLDESLNDETIINKIIEESKNKKVLIIVNTVASSIDLYSHIEDVAKNNGVDVNINLLHSMFIQEHRSILENNIKDFAKSKENGIWITTQLVEASLDIDFDILHTEISTLDSLFQRLGRCNRAAKKSVENTNVFIYIKDKNGVGTIYDEYVVNKGIEYVNQFCNDKQDGKVILSEKDKMDMIAKLYNRDNLDGSEFLAKFDETLKILDNRDPYEISKSEAQNILREINSFTVIPRNIYNDIRDTLIQEFYELSEKLSDAYNKKDRKLINKLKEEKRALKSEIIKKTVTIPDYKARKNGIITAIEIGTGQIRGLEDIYILECKYDVKEIEKTIKGKGVLLDEQLSQFI